MPRASRSTPTSSSRSAFITAYRYDHSETGSWKGTQLLSFKSKTDDNGTDHQINALQSGGKIALTVDGAATTAPKSVQAASLWGAAVSKQTQMFDPANGKRLDVDVADLGEEDGGDERRAAPARPRKASPGALPARPVVRRGRARQDDAARLGQFRDHLAAAHLDRIELTLSHQPLPRSVVARGGRGRARPLARARRVRSFIEGWSISPSNTRATIIPGICPEAWAALAEANEGHAPAYGEDPWDGARGGRLPHLVRDGLRGSSSPSTARRRTRWHSPRSARATSR